MALEDHPTVRRLAGRIDGVQRNHETPRMLEGAWLRRLATECGADDVGLVELARPTLDPQRDEILRNYPWTSSLLSFVVRMAREPVRGAPRSVANLEFHRAGEEVNEDRSRPGGQTRGTRDPGGQSLDGFPYGDVSDRWRRALGRFA